MKSIITAILLCLVCVGVGYAGQSRPRTTVDTQIVDPTTGDGMELDDSTNAAEFIEVAHHEAHAGKYFRSGMNYTLPNGQVATFAFVTSNTTTLAHITWDLSATADGTFILIEGITSLDGGASVTPLNHRRDSANTSTMTCTRGMTGSNLITPTGGTTILSSALGTGKGSVVNRSAGMEFIFKPNTKYLFQYTNGTSANTILLALEWYEHADRN